MENWKLFVFSGGKPDCLRDDLTQQEAERLALVICRAATFQYRVMPKRTGNLWYISDFSGMRPVFDIVCWIEPPKDGD